MSQIKKTPPSPRRHLCTQPGWDGTFVGIRPAGMVAQQGDEGIDLGSFPAPTFAGFQAQDERGVTGPLGSASNSQPSSGPFPGDGTGFDGFNRQNER